MITTPDALPLPQHSRVFSTQRGISQRIILTQWRHLSTLSVICFQQNIHYGLYEMEMSPGFDSNHRRLWHGCRQRGRCCRMGLGGLGGRGGGWSSCVSDIMDGAGPLPKENEIIRRCLYFHRVSPIYQVTRQIGKVPLSTSLCTLAHPATSLPPPCHLPATSHRLSPHPTAFTFPPGHPHLDFGALFK